MKKIIYDVGLRFSKECIELVAKWLLHANQLGHKEELSLFSSPEEQGQ